MSKKRLETYRIWISSQLDCCIDFWLKNAMDKENGGVYSCLDRKGSLYSTDKSVWIQGRTAWMFSYLCKIYGSRPEWLEAAESCLSFLESYCINHEAGGRLYFTVTADGKPLRQRRYWFSESFYIIANAEYAALTGNDSCLQRARHYYDLLFGLMTDSVPDPVGLPPKTIPETRKMRSLASPMIFLNVTGIMRRCDPENTELYNRRAKEAVGTILNYHYKPELGFTLESVGMNGEFLSEISAGRVLNPGHSIECSWFLMEEALWRGETELFEKAVEMFDVSLEKGWDTEYGGILYFVDALGHPSESYEHDMKLWWPHCEALIASLMIYREKKDEKYLDLFEKVLDYSKKVFSDEEYGEWYGYLRRDGIPTAPPCKGSTFKGFFHLPRMLVMTDKMLEALTR